MTGSVAWLLVGLVLAVSLDWIVSKADDVTTEELQTCIEANDCNPKYREDTCGICDREPRQYANGSQYMDCFEKCYTEETTADMAVVDVCGECGGDGTSCKPVVTGTDIQLVSATRVTTLVLTGTGLSTPNLQIVIGVLEAALFRRDVSSADKTRHGRVRRMALSVQDMAEIYQLQNDTQMTIRIHGGLAKGNYILGARIGNHGTVYKGQPGAEIYVYNESDFTIGALTPNETDLNRQIVNTEVTFDMGFSDPTFMKYTENKDILTYCIISDSANIQPVNPITLPTGIVNQDSTSIRFKLSIAMPAESKRLRVCPSLNGKLDLACKEITFYRPEPTIVNDEAKFSDTGDTLTIGFDMAVQVGDIAQSPLTCAAIFTDVRSLGDSPVCRLNQEKTILTITIGDNPTVRPGGTLEVKAGIRAATGAYRREMEATEITVVRNAVPSKGEGEGEGEAEEEEATPTSTIEVAPRGFWPSTLTGCALSPLTLGIIISQSATGRSPDSIVWTVNNKVQVAASNRQEVDVNIATPNTYEISVVVTSFLGDSVTFSHSVTKNALAMPNVQFSPQRLTPLANGQFSVHPSTIFGIGTRIQHGVCLDGTGDTLESFYFNWTRADRPVDGKFFYKSSRTENTIQMCSDVVQYALTVIRKADTDSTVKTTMDVKIVCRNPLAIIIGSRINEIAITYPDLVPIDGRSSIDLDGGELSYSWTCQVGGEDCLKRLDLTASRTRSVLLLKPSKLAVGHTYTFTLTVSVVKSDGTYTASSSVQYRAGGGNLPTVQIITLEHNFRHNVRILCKANITLPSDGNNITARWRFVPDLEGYDWVDLSLETVGKSNKVTGYTWYTILPNTLTPGRRYKMQVQVTLNGIAELTTTQDHDIYIYQPLRLCQLVARDITELQQTTLLLQSCVFDTAATKDLESSCKMGDKYLPNTDDLTFTVPVFKDRTLTRGKFVCQVRDSLGHTLTVESKEVVITLLSESTLNTALEDKIRDETSKDNLIETLELRASKITRDGQNSKGSDMREVVKSLKQIRENEPSARDLKRAIRSAMVVEPEKLSEEDISTAVSELATMAERLSAKDATESAARFSKTEIQETLGLARKLVKAKKRERRTYRKITESLACLQMKQMKNDEKEVTQLDDGSSMTVAVLTLDDVSSALDNVTFPEDIIARFRGLWQCKPTEVCDDVTVKQESYPIDPPDLQTDRSDTQCAQYVSMTLYNPKTCQSIMVRDNYGLIEFNIPTECARAKCYYFQETTDRFSQYGLTTKLDQDGSFKCQSDHLTMFTIRSEPEITTALNVPLLMAATVGSVLCVVCLFMLIRAWCLIKIDDLKKEIAEEKRLEELDKVYYNKALDGY